MSTTRRTLLSALTALPATSALAGFSALARAESLTTPPPWWLIEPLKVGSTLSCGWTVSELGPVADGGSVLTIKHSLQGSLRVHICLHDEHPRGYAFTELFDLIVMDQGRGVREVPTDLASALTQLSDCISVNELRQTGAIDDIAGMMSHAERVRAFGAGHLN